jgi:hypothetical protein
MKLRPWQPEAITTFEPVRLARCESPTGSGKSIVMRALAQLHLNADPRNITIIAVPQTNIRFGFQEPKSFEYMGQILHLPPAEWVSGGKGMEVLSAGVTYVTSHQTLALYLHKMDISRTLLIVDEAHHLADVGGIKTNQLSMGITAFLKKKTNRLFTFSATMFRTNGIPLLGEKFNEQAAVYSLDIERHFRENTEIRNVLIDPVNAQELVDGLRRYVAVNYCPPELTRDIIWIPSTASGDGLPDKYDFVEEYINIMKELHGYTHVYTDGNGIYTLTNGPDTEPFVLVDLITEEGRKETSRIADGMMKRDEVNAVLAMNLFKEGSDWEFATRGIVLGSRGSVLDIVQMMGRLFRGSPGKVAVQFAQVFKTRIMDETNFRDALDNYIKSNVVSLVMQELYPSKTELLKESTPRSPSLMDKPPHALNGLDLNQRVEVLADAAQTIMQLMAEHDEDKQAVKETFLREFTPSLPVEDVDRAVQYIFNRLTKPETNRGLQYDFSAMDDVIVGELSLTDHVRQYVCDTFSIDRLADIRERFSEGIRRSPEEWVPIAEKLAAENGGKLQPLSVLASTGHHGLIGAMRHHPELFAHIDQITMRKTDDQWVKIAEQLVANDPDKLLPNVKWLTSNGFSGLSQRMKANPEAFAHITQRQLVKTVDDHVADAEKLADEHNGLPNTNWLTQNKHHALYACMNANPEAFAHIKRGSSYKTPEEWVLVAEKLISTYGALPGTNELYKMGHSGLDRCIRAYPNLFAHIKRKEARLLGKIRSPKGKVFTLAEGEGNSFARKHGLAPSSLSLLLQGKQETHRGWTRVE